MRSKVKELMSHGRDTVRVAYESCEYLVPIHAKIMITGKCNLRCPKCLQWRKVPNKFSIGLRTSTLNKIVDDLASMGCRIIRFLGGEPTLRKDLPDLVENASNNGISACITSNGTLIDEALAFKLVENDLQLISISLDSQNESVHDQMVGVSGAWRKTVNALKVLNEARNQLGSDLEIVLNIVVTNKSFRNLDDYLFFASKMQVDKINFLPLATHHLEDKSFQIDSSELDWLRQHLSNRMRELTQKLGIRFTKNYPFGRRNEVYLNDGIFQTTFYDNSSCFVPWYKVYIKFDGRLVACCNTKPLVFKKVKDGKSIKAALSSRAYKSLRESCKPPVRNSFCRRCLSEIESNEKISKWLGIEDDELL